MSSELPPKVIWAFLAKQGRPVGMTELCEGTGMNYHRVYRWLIDMDSNNLIVRSKVAGASECHRKRPWLFSVHPRAKMRDVEELYSEDVDVIPFGALGIRASSVFDFARQLGGV